MKTSLEFINEFERIFQVEKWIVNDIHIWPAIRIPLMTAWERDLYYKDIYFDSEKKSAYYRVFSELKQLAIATLSFKKTPKGQYQVGVWGLDVERVLIQGKYYSPYGDGLRDLEFGDDLVSLDLTIKNRRVNHYPCGDITLGYIVNRYVAKIRSIIRVKADVQAPLKEATLWCQDRGLSSVGLTHNNLVYQYEFLRLVKNQFQRIIQKTQMRVCLKVCWYDTVGMALAWASKEMKIPCYDLQHGIAGSTKSRAYSAWSRFPSGGYKLMPSGFWCWSENDAKEINSWGSKLLNPISLFVGGNVLNRVLREDRLSVKLDPSHVVESNNVKILFTLQPAWSEDLPDILVGLIEKSPKGWSWLIRCHPMDMDNLSVIDRNLKKIMTDAEVDVIKTTEQLLPHLLMNIDIHITGWSAVLFDAKEFGIKTILCHPSAKILFKDILLSNEAVYMDDINQIMSEVRSNIDAYKTDPQRNKYSSFEGFLKNNEI